jgi:peptidyl-prolyl cis-trans isomerase D
MFDFVYAHKKLIQAALFVVFIPFAFFWVGDYMRDGGSTTAVAEVGQHTITLDEFNRSLRERQQTIQRVAEGRVNPEMLDNPGLRSATLEGLVQRRLLFDWVTRRGMTVTNEQIKNVIAEQRLFRDEADRFSYARYEQFLKSEGMTPAMFESRMRQDLVIRQVADGFSDTGFVPRAVAERLMRLSEQQRELSFVGITPDRFMDQVKLEADAAKKHYDGNAADFRVPEQARVEYVTLAIESLMQDVRLGADAAAQYYEANRNRYGVVESRQAAHILVAVDAGAGAEAKQKARAAAEDIYQQLRRKPDGFAELAKARSQDPGSASRGGDLGTMQRGSMKDAPAFEDALFKLKPGEISAPVETRHGFHVIRLTAVQPAKMRSLEEVRGEIEKELRKQLAARRFAELAENFANTVYEQSESLKPAADLIKAAPRTSGWIMRERAEPPLNNPRLLAAIFSEDTLKGGRNTEAIEAAPGTLVAARVVEHKPAAMRPFAEVRAEIEKGLALREAARLAAEEGRRQLDALRQGKDPGIKWSPPRLVGRAAKPEVPEPVVRQAFRVDVSKLPAYGGMESPRGAYFLLRITRVQESESLAPEKVKEFSEQLRQILGQEEIGAYISSLKQRVGVKINKELIEKKDESAPPPSGSPGPAPASKRRGGL